MMMSDQSILDKQAQYGSILDIGAIEISEKSDILSNAPLTVNNFEAAVAATKFGLFNYIIIFLTMLSSWSCLIVATNMSFVIPAAQCDLQLSLTDMGILNASPFVGMILSAFFWGYLTDTFGRRKTLIYGFLLESICSILCAFSFNLWMLAALKFLSGIIVCGPFTAIMSYLSEFHAANYRSKMILVTGIFASSIMMVMAFLAWIVMPITDFFIYDRIVHSWQIFLFICAVPSLASGLAFIFMPETPKFLITTGRREDALDILKKVYCINTGNSKDTFPFTAELDPIQENIPNISSKVDIKTSTNNSKIGDILPLFKRPHLLSLIMVVSMMFFTQLGANTLKLWLPQMFTAIDEYQQNFGTNTTTSICEILHFSANKTNGIIDVHVHNNCVIVPSNAQVYINSIIVGICSILMYIFAIIIINKMKKKILLGIIYFATGVSGIALIWATNPLLVLSLSSIYSSLSGIAVVTNVAITVELFPTNLRTMALSFPMTSGRVSTIAGNVIFPILLKGGCVPPFLLIGGSLLVCILPLLLLPSTEKLVFL